MSAFTTSRWVMDKTGASADGGMVVAKQEQAALAGARALADGGNAVDAAVAAALVMKIKALPSRRCYPLRLGAKRVAGAKVTGTRSTVAWCDPS